MTDVSLFIFAVLTVLATPGPTNTLLAASGAASGMRRSLVLVPAELAGYLAAIMLFGFVIGDMLWTRPWLSGLFRLCAAVYLVYLASRLWQTNINVESRRTVKIIDVLTTTFLNPKAAIFAFIIIPMHDQRWLVYLAGFGLLVVLMSFFWIAVGISSAKGLNVYRGLVPRIGATIILLFATVVTWPVVKAVETALG